MAGGTLVLPMHQNEGKPTSVTATSKGKKSEKPHAAIKISSTESKGKTSKDADKSTATASGAASDSGQRAGVSSCAAGVGADRAGDPASSVEEYLDVKQDDTTADAGMREEGLRPFLSWGEKEVHFYRGRRFLAQLMHTIDLVGGVWLYLVPKWKAPPNDDRGAKSSSKHPKATSSLKSKPGNKPDPQLTVEACRRLAGRAWVPLDILRKGGCSEVSGSFALQPLEAETGGGEEENCADPDTPGGRKPEPLNPEGATPPESFKDAQTHVKLSICLKNPLLSLHPRDIPPLEKDVSEDAPPHLSSTKVPFTNSLPTGTATETSSEVLPDTPPAPAAYSPAHGSGCPSSLTLFKKCVQQGIRWIAREIAGSVSPAQQHLLAAVIASDRSLPLTSGAPEAAAAAKTKLLVDGAFSATYNRYTAAEPEGVAKLFGNASSLPSAAAAWPRTGISSVDAADAATQASHSDGDPGIPRYFPRVTHGSSGGALGNEGHLGTAAAATEELVKQLRQCGCYDELYQKVMRAVCTVVRDQLRQDVVLTAAAAAASPVGQVAVDCSGYDAQRAEKGDPTQRLSTGLLQLRLDRFFSEVFVQLVDTLQSTVYDVAIKSQRVRERSHLQAPEPSLWKSPEEAEAAVFGRARDCAPAVSASSRSRLLHHQPTEQETAETLARLSFEAEVVGDMQRSIYLHKCRLVSLHGQQDPSLWFALARLLLRTDEAHVEQAEKALWKCIDAYGGPEEASPESLLMLGSCLLHRKCFRQASAAFSRALQRCTAPTCPAPPREALALHEVKQHEERQPQQDAAASVPDTGGLKGSCVNNATSVAPFDSCTSAFSGISDPAPSEVLPYFFLCMSYYFSGDTRRFDKYLSLALKPAAYFQLDGLIEHWQEELGSVTEEKKAPEDADERPGSAVLSPPSAWPEKSFEQLEQTLSTFPRDTFYTPMEVDYPVLSLLLLLLKFGLSSLCFSVLALEDTLLHPATRASSLMLLIKAKAHVLKNDFCSAAEALHQLLATCPKHREALALLAECYFRQSLVKPAVDYYMRSLDFFETPRDCVIYLRLGQLMLEEKDYEAACKYYKQSLQLSTTCEAWLGLAAALYRMRRLSEALEAATAANWLDRARGETWGYLALILLRFSSNDACELCSSNAEGRDLTSSDTCRGPAYDLYNRESHRGSDHPNNASQRQSSTDVLETSSESGSCKHSILEDGTCRPSVIKERTCTRHSCRAPPSSISSSHAGASTKHTSEANTCTQYMLKNGAGGNLGIGRLGGITSVQTKLSLNPDTTAVEEDFTAKENLSAYSKNIRTLEWGGGLLVEVAHLHLEVRGAYAAEVAEAVARRALENPLCGVAAAHKVLSEALELQGRYAATFEELLQVMELLVQEFEQEQRKGLRALVLMQQHLRSVTPQQKQYQQALKQQEDGQEQRQTLRGYSAEELKQQVIKQKAITYAKLAETQVKARNVAARLSNNERASLKSKEEQLLRRVEEMTFESLLPRAVPQMELEPTYASDAALRADGTHT